MLPERLVNVARLLALRCVPRVVPAALLAARRLAQAQVLAEDDNFIQLFHLGVGHVHSF